MSEADRRQPISLEKPTRVFTIDSTKDPMDAEICPFDGGQLTKSVIPFSIEGANFIVEHPNAPGLECSDCDAGIYTNSVAAELHETAANILDTQEDRQLIEILRESAQRLRS